jgi:hypothetical protein
MTKSRPEIVIEGSIDGVEWRAYEFRWKPGDLNRPPPWVAPHQPRLDWQMWFARLELLDRTHGSSSWLGDLLEESPSVMGLLAYILFPIRTRVISAPQLTITILRLLKSIKPVGAWWKREGEREYLPPISLKQ